MSHTSLLFTQLQMTLIRRPSLVKRKGYVLSQKLLEAWARSMGGGTYKLRGSGFHKECIDLKAKEEKAGHC